MTNLFPDHYYNSAYEIPYEDLFAAGKRAVIFDIDNTLVTHGAPADEKSARLIKRLQAIGFKVCFLSNNREERVKSFNEKLGACYVYKAGKPKRSGYLKAMEMTMSDKNTAVFVGDQIYTDVYGARRTGIETFLTKPIDKREEFQIILKRIIEKPILLAYKIYLKIHKRR
ncbi:MAG: HAD-IIIA family hydrolase [Lachnospiraceae bacterium]|nr:HAD-IIIA family hydrolase [Lachnospiraceae bacterium]